MLEIVSRIGGQVVGTDQQEIARTSGGSPEAISSRRQFPSDTPCNFLGILIGSNTLECSDTVAIQVATCFGDAVGPESW